MENYKDKNGSSGIIAYRSGDQYIILKFDDGDLYVYNYASRGPDKIEKMKELARRGEGLATYISKSVREAYAKKIS